MTEKNKAGYGRSGARFAGPYQECGVCGLEYPESEMTQQRGHLVCDSCLDDAPPKHSQDDE